MQLSRRQFLKGVVAGAALSITGLPVLAQGGPVYCPILMYHYISAAPAGSPRVLVDLTVPPEAFAQHLNYIRDAGYTTITMQALWAGMTGAAALPERPIVLTFDDGYWDMYANAAPLLFERGMTGVVYVVTSFADQPGYLTWEQIRALRSGGIEIGNHSHIHGDMSRQGPAQQRSEIETSTQQLEAALGSRPTTFCYPFGRQNGHTRSLLAEYGYTTAVTTQNLTLHYTVNPYRMGRMRVRNSTTVEALPWLIGRHQ